MESVEDKQSYLRSEIIDKGYDPDEFFNFLSSFREGEIQLEDWTMKELKNVVNKFQSNKNISSIPNMNMNNEEDNTVQNDNNYNQNEDNSNTNQNNETEQSENKENQEDYNKNINETNDNNQNNINENNLNNQELENKMNSLDFTLLDKNLTQNQNLENTNINNQNNENQKKENIQTSQKPELKSEKIDSSLNKLSTNPFEDFSVYFPCQKFEDHEIINKEDLKIIVSEPVLKKEGFFSWSYYQYTISTPELNYKVERKLTDFDWLYQKLKEIYPGLIVSSVPARHVNMKDNSDKKMIYLNFFMNSLSHYKFIRATPIFQFFLSLNLKDFEKKKKEFEKIHVPNSFENFCNLEGNISCIITEQRDKTAISLKDDIAKKTLAFNKLTQSFDLVLSAFENCKNAMKNLSESFKNLQLIYSSQKNFSEKFERLSQTADKWSNGYKDQSDFFQKELRYFFKFMEKELNDSLKVYEDFKMSRNAYVERYNKLKKVKNIPKNDYLNLDFLHKYYGYYLSTYLTEYDNLNKRHEERMNYQFIKYCNNTDIFIQDYNTFISLLNFNN